MIGFQKNEKIIQSIGSLKLQKEEKQIEKLMRKKFL